MKKIIQMLVVLTVIGVISGGVLSQIFSWAEPQIIEHQKEEIKKAIFEVQTGSEFKQIENDALALKKIQLYEVYDEAGTMTGYAAVLEGNGFQGKIRLMVGITSDLTELTGMQVLEQVETPGLGTKIVTDPSNKENPSWFPDQFKGRTPELTYVKNQKPSSSTEIQAITAATISSEAVVTIVNTGIAEIRNEIGKAGGEE